MNWHQIQTQAIIGLTLVAVQYIQNGNYQEAEDTLLGMIMELEGTRGEA